jgi:GNAT superfamily N-acetyltransferase
MDYAIAPARARDVAALGAIEVAAGALLRGHAPDHLLTEPTDAQELRDAQAAGHLWVALVDDVPVGFARVEVLDDGTLHLAELDVDPRFGRHGIGTALVRAVCDAAAASGYASLTLTTFRAVRWNMPFYAGLGFLEVPDAALTPALAAVVADETARGLDPRARVAMRRPLASD